MFHIAEYGAQVVSHIAMEAHRLSLGALMDPAEVANTVTPHQPDAVTGRWWLCGNMHPQMFAAAHTRPLRHLGKVIVTNQGTKYLVLAQQVGAWQHRLLLQVAGRQVLDFLAGSIEVCFDLSLQCIGGDESLLVADCTFVRALVCDMDVQGEAAANNVSPHRLRQEACMLATSLLRPAEVIVEELTVPQHVCVTIVASRDLVCAVVKQDARSR